MFLSCLCMWRCPFFTLMEASSKGISRFCHHTNLSKPFWFLVKITLVGMLWNCNLPFHIYQVDLPIFNSIYQILFYFWWENNAFTSLANQNGRKQKDLGIKTLPFFFFFQICWHFYTTAFEFGWQRDKRKLPIFLMIFNFQESENVFVKRKGGPLQLWIR